MQNAIVASVLVFVLGAGGFWLTHGKGVDASKDEAAKQAAAYAMDLYPKEAPQVPVPAESHAQTAAAATPSPSQTAGPQQTPVTKVINNKKIMQATLHTNEGDITIEFLYKDAPNTVANFTKLAGEGFYNDTKFHRVIKGFMIQGGDPLTKDDSMMARWGTGGPGYQFADEIHANNHNDNGTIAMANSGPGTNGSQFFINVADNNFLDAKHTVFGKVVAGMDVVTKIEDTATGASDRLVSPMVINSITLQ